MDALIALFFIGLIVAVLVIGAMVVFKDQLEE